MARPALTLMWPLGSMRSDDYASRHTNSTPDPIVERPFSRMDKPFPWPAGMRCAVMLTFDFDGETLWFSRDPENACRPGILSQGVYGGQGWRPQGPGPHAGGRNTGDFLRSRVDGRALSAGHRADLADGHEVGHHRAICTNGSIRNSQIWKKKLSTKGWRRFLKIGGIEPKGFRSPAGESTPT